MDVQLRIGALALALLPLLAEAQAIKPYHFAPRTSSGTVPTITAETGNVDNTEGTSHTVVLPATVNANELLLVLITFQNPTPGAVVVTWDDSTHGTWTQLLNQGNGRVMVYAKVAAGTEDGGSLSITTDVSARHARRTLSIANWEGTIAGGVNLTSVASGTSTAPNSTVATDSWGAVARRTITFYQGDGTLTDGPDPSGYTLNPFTHATGGASTDTTLGGAMKTGIEGVQDPGVWTISASVSWRAFTLSIRGTP